MRLLIPLLTVVVLASVASCSTSNLSVATVRVKHKQRIEYTLSETRHPDCKETNAFKAGVEQEQNAQPLKSSHQIIISKKANQFSHSKTVRNKRSGTAITNYTPVIINPDFGNSRPDEDDDWNQYTYMSIISCALGITAALLPFLGVAFWLWAVLFAIAAFVLGIIAVVHHKYLGIVGIILGALVILIAILLIVIVIAILGSIM